MGELAVANVAQPSHIAALAYGPALDDQWGAPSRPVDFFDVKKDSGRHDVPAELRRCTGPNTRPFIRGARPG
jgi:phenylalanyl-tRNA synthetase beta chain